MDSTTTQSRRRANRFFALGWFLTSVNLLGVLWAIWLPIDLYAREHRWSFLFFDWAFFFLDEQVPYAFWACMSLLGLIALALAEILFLERLTRRMVADLPETAAAEAALNVARYSAYVTIIFCMLSFVWDIRIYSRWESVWRILQSGQ